MSGFVVLDGQLVYDALSSKWARHHARWCGCGEDWLVHVERAPGFVVVADHGSHVVILGPGLTEGVEEWDVLTADPLWELVTGRPGNGVLDVPNPLRRGQPAESHAQLGRTMRGAASVHDLREDDVPAPPVRMRVDVDGRRWDLAGREWVLVMTPSGRAWSVVADVPH